MLSGLIPNCKPMLAIFLKHSLIVQRMIIDRNFWFEPRESASAYG